MYQIHQTTLAKWDLKTNEHPAYGQAIEQNLQLATRIDDAYSTGVFARQREDHAAAVKKFTHVRKEHAALNAKYAVAVKELAAARNAVDAGSHNNEIALKNFAVFVAAEASQNAFACELAAQEAVVNAAASAIVKRNHDVDKDFEGQGNRYVMALCHPLNPATNSSQDYTRDGQMIKYDPKPRLLGDARGHGAALTLEQSKWIPFANEIARLFFAAEIRKIKSDGAPSLSDLETILQARSNAFEAAQRGKRAQIESLTAQLRSEVSK